MIKVTYDYKGKHIEEECVTCLEASVLEDSLKENPHVSNLDTIYD